MIEEQELRSGYKAADDDDGEVYGECTVSDVDYTFARDRNL